MHVVHGSISVWITISVSARWETKSSPEALVQIIVGKAINAQSIVKMVCFRPFDAQSMKCHLLQHLFAWLWSLYISLLTDTHTSIP